MQRKYIIILSIFVGLTGILSLSFYFFTVQFFETYSKAFLRLNDVELNHKGPLYTFEKNNCSVGTNCGCVLLIHGLGDNAFTWNKTLAVAKENWDKKTHFYAINLPGSLETQKLSVESEYSISNLTDILAQNILPLCESWVLVGNSFGGWLAVDISEKHPQKIKGLVLTAPAGLKKDYSHILNYFLNPTLSEIKSFVQKTYYDPVALPDFVYLQIIEQAKTKPIVPMLKAVQDTDFLDLRLSQNSIPTQIIWGEKDGVMPVAWAKEFHEKMPNSELHIVEKCGHIPQKECFDQFFKITNEFLSKTL